MPHIAVLGAGTMGHGIAQVCAMAGDQVRLSDPSQQALDRALSTIRLNLDKGVERGKVSSEIRDLTQHNLHAAGSLGEACEGADFIIEAVPEKLPLKQRIVREICEVAPAHAIIGTNTSSLSIGAIASAADDPGRVIGTHFFNPVHIMALLELVVAELTSNTTLQTARAFGQRIGKEVIVVRDVPGFATSRLGVALGMEAIRMVEQGVASAEDIDKAMVLGYRHPIGPLRLTDLVGLDVRMHIGEYLARELENPAFEPPELLRTKVARGELGKKVGRGFYTWQ
ncbi:MAG: 3-hydroxyacyl-CoA dehydrogenase family protein [Deltaproteobacteria bacterium]|nr:MAG: 3-hydroxyacyl-CoA dehydrogenase family protein [Deltaproteobacteria bacterium]